MDSILIVGAGAWGTALAVLCERRGHAVTLWSRSLTEEINHTRTNARHLPGVNVPQPIVVTSNLRANPDIGFVIWATPSTALEEISRQLAESGTVAPDAICVSAVKGIELTSGLRMSEVLGRNFPNHAQAVLSGPNHAIEIARKIPSATVVGSDQPEVAGTVQALLASPEFRVYTSPDVAGIEIGGALKNIFALGAGIGDGLGLGDNAKAALVTRALAELVRLGIQLGGRRETFYGLSGVGDLMVTCFSRHSRNRRAGELLAEGKRLAEVTEILGTMPEGIPTTRSVYRLAQKLGLNAPITTQVYRVLEEQAEASEALRRLLERELRPEADE
jgi:glycerol-3-phosphate dehydrogenase (NAD(P)+)